MFNLFPGAIYELSCNSFNERRYENFKVCIKPEDFTPIAHDYYIDRLDLFDFNRPIIIEKSSWMWNSNFIEIFFYWKKKCNFYYDGKKCSTFTQIQLKPNKISCGLKNWKKRYSYFLHLMDENNDKELIKRYRQKIQEINKEVKRWEEAIKGVGKIKL